MAASSDNRSSNVQSRQTDGRIEKSIEDVLRQCGPTTKFNVLVHLIAFYISLTVNGNKTLAVFTGHEASWKCRTRNATRFCSENYNRTLAVNDIGFYQRCHLPRSQWEYTEPTSYSFVTEFDLSCERRVIAALISSAYFIGGVIGVLLSGLAADTFGRKPVIVITLFSCFISSFGGSFIFNPWQLIILNILVGAATFSCFSITFTYLLEIASPDHRSFSNTFLQLGFTSSFLLVNLAAYYLKEWRKLKLYSSMPCAFAILPAIFLPESPRWLLIKGKYFDANLCVKKILRLSGSKFDFVLKNDDKWASEQKHGMKVFFSNKHVFLLTFSIAFTRFVNFVVYYTLIFGSPNLGGDLHISFALSLLPNIVANTLFPLVAQRCGRRILWLVCIGLAGLMLCGLAVIPQSFPYRFYLNLILTILAIFFTVTALNVVYTWSFELFPTAIRSEGLSLCVMVDCIGIASTPFLLNLSFELHHSLPYVITALLILTGLFNTYKMLPETSKQPTREKLTDFVGKVKNSVSDVFSVGNPGYGLEQTA